MINKYNISIFLFCLLCTKTIMANYTYSPTHEKLNVNQSFQVTDSAAAPDNWLKLNKLNIGTANTLSDGLEPCLLRNFMCTAASVSLGYNGKASYILTLSRKPVTITDNVGNEYKISLAFPDKAPVLGVYEYNNQGGRKWNTTPALSLLLDSPSDRKDATSIISTAQGYCGNVGGCEYMVGGYIHTNSGMPYIYVKLPKNISAHSVTFKDLEVLELYVTVGNRNNDNVTSMSAKLYLSGTISVPQRCYIKADKNNFDFGTVYSNSDDILLKNMSTTITTDCYYAPDNTKQYLKIKPVSGGALDNGSMVYRIASDSALGIVFNINNSSECTSSNQKEFNREYLIRSITYQQHQATTDTVNFALCKYGVPSVTGQKNVILKLTSRWVVD